MEIDTSDKSQDVIEESGSKDLEGDGNSSNDSCNSNKTDCTRLANEDEGRCFQYYFIFKKVCSYLT